MRSSWITRTFGGVTTAITNVTVKYALDPSEEPAHGRAVVDGRRLRGVDRLARVAAVGPRRCSRSLCIAAVGVLGMWDDSMNTLSQVMVAVVVSVALAIPLGIWCALSDRVERALKPILDMMQTMPQFVYLVPVVALFRSGARPRRDRRRSCTRCRRGSG